MEKLETVITRVDELSSRFLTTEAETRLLLGTLKEDIADLVKLIRGNGRPGMHDDFIALRSDFTHLHRRVKDVECERVRGRGFVRTISLQIISWAIAAAAVLVAFLK